VCAIGVRVNGVPVFLTHFLRPDPASDEAISTYAGNDENYFFIATLVTGKLFTDIRKNLIQ
jgi:hypothetical protein